MTTITTSDSTAVTVECDGDSDIKLEVSAYNFRGTAFLSADEARKLRAELLKAIKLFEK